MLSAVVSCFFSLFVTVTVWTLFPIICWICLCTNTVKKILWDIITTYGSCGTILMCMCTYLVCVYMYMCVRERASEWEVEQRDRINDEQRERERSREMEIRFSRYDVYAVVLSMLIPGVVMELMPWDVSMLLALTEMLLV